jgi:hypothetical protein
MTEVLVGLIAVLPALLGFMNSRRRQLALIKEEISVYNELPDGLNESRDAMRTEIVQSVAYYRGRQSRHIEMFMAFGFTVGWLLLLLGYNLYRGTITDPETTDSLRKYAGAALIGVGSAVLVLSIVFVAIRGYLAVKVWWLGRKVKRLEKELKEKDARIDALDQELAQLRERLENVVSEILEAERAARERGDDPKPRPSHLAEVFEEYETKGSLIDYEPSPELTALLKQNESPDTPEESSPSTPPAER